MLTVEKTTAYNPTLSRTIVNGYPFHTEVHGSEDRPAIIVIHGGPGGDFTSLLPLRALSDQFRVVFYDQRGTGLSPRENAAGHTIEKFLQDLDGIVDAFRKKRFVHLIGHSWGGMLAAAYLGRHPRKVSSAVIAEPGILTPESAEVFFKGLRDNRSVWSMIKVVPHLLASFFVTREDGHEPRDYVMTRILGAGKGKPYQCKGERLPRGSFRRAGYASFASLMMPYMRQPEKFTYDLTSGLASYKGRILLLSSECSFIGYDYQEKYHRRFFPVSTKQVMVTQTGHNMITLRPKESVQIIRDFLQDSSSYELNREG
jgi:proline iminopeptidase